MFNLTRQVLKVLLHYLTKYDALYRPPSTVTIWRIKSLLQVKIRHNRIFKVMPEVLWQQISGNTL